MEREPRHPKEPNRYYHSRKNRRDARTEKEQRHKEREPSHQCQSERQGRSRDNQDQFKSNRKKPRIQHDFTIKQIDQKLGKERFDQKGRDPSYGDESKREIVGYQMKSRNQQVVWRNWPDLPRDVMLLILSKVGIMEILRTAPLVCSQWQHLAKDPILFRSVVLSRSLIRGTGVLESEIIRKAAPLSCGGLVEFWCSSMISVFLTDLQHLVPSTHSIKSLRLGTLIHFQIPELVQIVKCMSSLEDIYLSDYIWPKGVLDVIGTSCPNLKSASFGTFCLSGHGAFSIANTMPRLRCLYLRGCFLTMEALEAILDGCRSLEYLHVEGLSNVTNLEGKYARNYQCKSYFKEYVHEYVTERIWELELKRNDDLRPSLVGSSNGYELSSLPFLSSILPPLVWVKSDEEES